MEKDNEFTTVKEIGEEEIYAKWYRCNECDCMDILDTYNFCPICGKRIDW